MAGGFQYLETKLNYFPHPEGYVTIVDDKFRYVYNYTDHLGNVRLSYSDADADGAIDSHEIMEENNYYPFGLKHEGYNSDVVLLNKYKYNGKEYQDELGLNFYDYGARNYDPALGRWMNIDPLAERYYGVNPYAYVFNNPIELLDPDGMRIRYAREEGQTRKEFREAKREFKASNRQLMRDSKTHRNNFKQLKSSSNTHTISFTKNGSEVTTLDKNGNKTNVVDRENGNDTNIQIDLNQAGSENEFVIAHEIGHAIDNDNGTDSPVELNVSMSDPIEVTQQKMLQNENDNREANEMSASHTENIVRGEVSNSRGVQIPLRKTYTYPERSIRFKQVISKDKTINVIRKNYDYYKKNN